MKDFRRVNNVVGWVIFIIAAFTYLSTMEGTASLWDCAEFIASTYKLEVGHPPGAPFFNILGRVFTLFSGPEAWTAAPSANAAVWVNSLSALSSAFTILFLFWSISHLSRKLLQKAGEAFPLSSTIACVGAGAVGALAYTFSDTFWFSAVEGEVYAMSSLFTAAVFWLILKWEDNADSSYCNRWLVLIMYLVGLSVGVHLLNLLVLPAMALVFYFKKYEFTIKGLLITLGVSMGLIVCILFGVVPGIVYLVSKIDYFTNIGLGLPLHTGTIAYLVALVLVFVAGIYTTAYGKSKNTALVLFVLGILLSGMPFFLGGAGGIIITLILLGVMFALPYKPQILNTILTCLFVLFIGYSSFAMVMIRSHANPPMDENSPDDAFTLQSYLSRDQYGSTPLFKGQYFSSVPIDYIDGGNEYKAFNGRYEKVGTKTSYKYAPETIFPRMYSDQPGHAAQYRLWSGMDKHPGITKLVRGKTIEVPTMGQNLTYFWDYQVNWMYWRYFMWNFSGRQNDTQGYGHDPIRGNWISGIPFIDDSRVGTIKDLPSRMKNDPTRNVYYMLPLILGLLGLGFQLFHKNKGVEGFLIVLMLFLMTGLAIILFLNQPPLQPRERDYAYAGSFYAFAMWIGLGVLAVVELVKNENQRRIVALFMTAVCLVLVPGIMAQQNWPDHNRSRRSVANDLGYNYLMSCAPNAILFTYGDNDTFPLWYLQEVEGVRTDVRVCNLSYFQIDWYIEQMAKKAYESEPFPFSLTTDKYRGDKLNMVLLAKNNGAYNLKDLIGLVAKGTKDANGRDYIPTNHFIIPVDVAKVLATGDVPAGYEHKILPQIDFTLDKNFVTKQELMLLDLLANNNWNRPIYFATSVGSDKHLGLSKYMHNEGMAYRFVPVDGGGVNALSSINTDIMYDNVMNKFRYGGLNKPGYILMDFQAARMFLSLRQTLVSLAQALYAEGKNDKALNVIEKCITELPDRNLPMGYCSTMPAEVSALTISDLLSKLGKKEQAEALLQEMADQSKEELVWFLEQKPYLFSQGDYERARSVYVSAGQLMSTIKNDPKIYQSYVDEVNTLQKKSPALNVRP